MNRTRYERGPHPASPTQRHQSHTGLARTGSAVVVTGLWIGLVCSQALAGVVRFEPATTVVGPCQGIVSFDLTIVADNPGGFDSADVLLLSNGVALVDFEYSPEWRDSVLFPSIPILEPPQEGLLLGGFALVPMGPEMPFGTLTVGVCGLGPGAYDVYVMEDPEGISVLGLMGATELLSGRGTVRVVPEPGTLSLLALGALARLRRRRPRPFRN